jgi:serine/threonine protein kinase
MAEPESEVYIHNYKLLNKLGKGSFSTVFKGVHRINGKYVAIKIEKEPVSLKNEAKVISYLNREMPNSVNIPTLYWYGFYGDNICMTTPYYETSFSDYTGRIWSEPDPFIKLLGLCEQLVHVVRQIHSAHIIHSDIKPDNFMIHNRETLVMIDFGLSSLFYNVEKDVMRENKLCEHMTGSPRYASYNVHVGNSVSYRDDLISIGYIMMMVFKVDLPWINIQILEEEEETMLSLNHVRHPANKLRVKYKSIDNLKKYLNWMIEKNHQSSHYIGHYLIPYFEKTYALKYEDVPNYLEYKSMFITLY